MTLLAAAVTPRSMAINRAACWQGLILADYSGGMVAAALRGGGAAAVVNSAQRPALQSLWTPIIATGTRMGGNGGVWERVRGGAWANKRMQWPAVGLPAQGIGEINARTVQLTRLASPNRPGGVARVVLTDLAASTEMLGGSVICVGAWGWRRRRREEREQTWGGGRAASQRAARGGGALRGCGASSDFSSRP